MKSVPGPRKFPRTNKKVARWSSESNSTQTRGRQPSRANNGSTIGAGDTFIAGMLYAMMCKDKVWDVTQKLMFANQVAGMKVLQEGFSGLDRAFTAQFQK